MSQAILDDWGQVLADPDYQNAPPAVQEATQRHWLADRQGQLGHLPESARDFVVSKVRGIANPNMAQPEEIVTNPFTAFGRSYLDEQANNTLEGMSLRAGNRYLNGPAAGQPFDSTFHTGTDFSTPGDLLWDTVPTTLPAAGAVAGRFAAQLMTPSMLGGVVAAPLRAAKVASEVTPLTAAALADYREMGRLAAARGIVQPAIAPALHGAAGGGAYMGASDVASQYAETGQVDPEQVLASTSFGAAAGLLLGGAAPFVKNVAGVDPTGITTLLDRNVGDVARGGARSFARAAGIPYADEPGPRAAEPTAPAAPAAPVDRTPPADHPVMVAQAKMMAAADRFKQAHDTGSVADQVSAEVHLKRLTGEYQTAIEQAAKDAAKRPVPPPPQQVADIPTQMTAHPLYEQANALNNAMGNISERMRAASEAGNETALEALNQEMSAVRAHSDAVWDQIAAHNAPPVVAVSVVAAEPVPAANPYRAALGEHFGATSIDEVHAKQAEDRSVQQAAQNLNQERALRELTGGPRAPGAAPLTAADAFRQDRALRDLTDALAAHQAGQPAPASYPAGALDDFIAGIKAEHKPAPAANPMRPSQDEINKALGVSNQKEADERIHAATGAGPAPAANPMHERMAQIAKDATKKGATINRAIEMPDGHGIAFLTGRNGKENHVVVSPSGGVVATAAHDHAVGPVAYDMTGRDIPGVKVTPRSAVERTVPAAKPEEAKAPTKPEPKPAQEWAPIREGHPWTNVEADLAERAAEIKGDAKGLDLLRAAGEASYANMDAGTAVHGTAGPGRSHEHAAAIAAHESAKKASASAWKAYEDHVSGRSSTGTSRPGSAPKPDATKTPTEAPAPKADHEKSLDELRAELASMERAKEEAGGPAQATPKTALDWARQLHAEADEDGKDLFNRHNTGVSNDMIRYLVKRGTAYMLEGFHGLREWTTKMIDHLRERGGEKAVTEIAPHLKNVYDQAHAERVAILKQLIAAKENESATPTHEEGLRDGEIIPGVWQEEYDAFKQTHEVRGRPVPTPEEYKQMRDEHDAREAARRQRWQEEDARQGLENGAGGARVEEAPTAPEAPHEQPQAPGSGSPADRAGQVRDAGAQEHLGGKPQGGEAHGGGPADLGGERGRPDQRAADGTADERPAVQPGDRVGDERGPVRNPLGVERPKVERPDETGQRPTGKPGELTPKPDAPIAAGANYHIPSDVDPAAGGKKTKLRANLDAIALLNALQKEGRRATADEQAILAKYVGWGGIPEAFNWNHPNDKTFANAFRELADLLGGTGSEAYQAALASVTNAHYTAKPVIEAIYHVLGEAGFKGGNVLEPGMGTGNFFGWMPREMKAASHLTGVELDKTTGSIATQLYPKAAIHVKGFQDVPLPADHFDLVIGNVPFSNNVKPLDKTYNPGQRLVLHDYYFNKALAVTKPGGIVAFITSAGTLDKGNPAGRILLAGKADLVAAVRIPADAFRKNAMTDVTTDLLIFRKRLPGEERGDMSWLGVSPVKVGEADLNMNNYYRDHPENLLGTPSDDKLHPGRMALTGDKRDIGEAIQKALSTLPSDLFKEHESMPEPSVDDLLPPSSHIREDAYTIHDGKLVQRVNNRMVPFSPPKGVKDPEGRARGMVAIRDIARDLLNAQHRDLPDAGIKALQAKLGKVYDAFVAKHGILHSRSNVRTFVEDPDLPILLSLEHYDADTKTARKADIFTKRTVAPNRRIEHADNAQDAMIGSLAEKGKVDLDFMSRITGQEHGDLLRDLGDRVYEDPSEGWKTSEDYLSGNVRQKLVAARAAAESNPDFARNVEALERVQPADIPMHEIEVRLGVPWLPPDVLQSYIGHKLGIGANAFTATYSQPTAKWIVEPNRDNYSYGYGQANENHGGGGKTFLELLNDIMNFKDTRVYVKSGKDSVFSPDLTELARQAKEAIKDDFREWLPADEARSTRMVRAYNDIYNGIVTRKYDGNHLQLPGKNPSIDLREHQKAAIWRITQDRRALLAHAVGAGKTYTMVGASMELKRMGIAKKPLHVVPNHMLVQYPGEFKQLYPAARILAVTGKDLEKGNRQKLFARIATGNWDAVIVTHSQLIRLPVGRDIQAEIHQEELDQIAETIAREEAAGGGKKKSDNALVKELVKARERIETKLAKLNDAIKDEAVTFEQLGIDHLFLDESHNFKNLFYTTKMNRVKGLGDTEGSKRSFDLYAKIRYIQKTQEGRGVTFATGTPLTNSMAELYTIQRYLTPEILADQGTKHFDAWAASFGDTVTTLALKNGRFQPETRFATFHNLPELLSSFHTVADVKLAEDLGLPTPDLETGKVQAVVAEPSPALIAYTKELIRRANAIKGPPQKGADNHLMITSLGRNAALSMRMIDDGYHDAPGSKIDLLVRNVLKIHKDGTGATVQDPSSDLRPKENLAQLIFLDTRTPKEPKKAKGVEKAVPDDAVVPESEDAPEGGPQDENEGDYQDAGSTSTYSPYQDIKDRLIEGGIPADQIAFIHDAKNDLNKAKLMAEVRAGRIRVLLGSTAKMGEGTNMQRLLVALHHVDATWTPAGMEQRNGRILRQGNWNRGERPVSIFAYTTAKSFDANMFSLLASKQRWINQIMRGDTSIRKMEDLDSGSVLDPAMMAALSSGSPLVLERANNDMRINQLEVARRGAAQKIAAARDNARYQAGVISEMETKAADAQKDLATYDANDNGEHEAIVDGVLVKGQDDITAALEAAREKFKNEYEARYEAGDKIGGTKVIGKFKGLDIVANIQEQRYMRVDKPDGKQDVVELSKPIFTARSSVQGKYPMSQVRHSLKSEITSATERKAAAEKNLAASIEGGKAAFKGQDELNTLKARQAELIKQMDADAKAEDAKDAAERAGAGQESTAPAVTPDAPDLADRLEADGKAQIERGRSTTYAGTMGGGVNPDLVIGYGKLLASHIIRAGRNLAVAARARIEEAFMREASRALGDRLAPMLDAIKAKAQEYVDGVERHLDQAYRSAEERATPHLFQQIPFGESAPVGHPQPMSDLDMDITRIFDRGGDHPPERYVNGLPMPADEWAREKAIMGTAKGDKQAETDARQHEIELRNRSSAAWQTWMNQRTAANKNHMEEVDRNKHDYSDRLTEAIKQGSRAKYEKLIGEPNQPYKRSTLATFTERGRAAWPTHGELPDVPRPAEYEPIEWAVHTDGPDGQDRATFTNEAAANRHADQHRQEHPDDEVTVEPVHDQQPPFDPNQPETGPSSADRLQAQGEADLADARRELTTGAMGGAGYKLAMAHGKIMAADLMRATAKIPAHASQALTNVHDLLTDEHGTFDPLAVLRLAFGEGSPKAPPPPGVKLAPATGSPLKLTSEVDVNRRIPGIEKKIERLTQARAHALANGDKGMVAKIDKAVAKFKGETEGLYQSARQTRGMAADAAATVAPSLHEPGPQQPGVVFTPGPLPTYGGEKKVGNLNMWRIQSTDDILATAGELRRQAADQIQAAKGPTETHAMLAEMARVSSFSLEDLLKNGPQDRAEILAGRNFLIASAQGVKEMSDRFDAARAAGHAPSDADRLEFMRRMDLHFQIDSTMAGAATEWGRTGHAFKIPSRTTAKQVRDISQAIDRLGRDKIDALADLIAKMDNIGDVSAAARAAAEPSNWDKTVEYFINSILSAPTTHLRNIVGNSLNVFSSLGEDAIAAGIGHARGNSDAVTMREVRAKWTGLLAALPEARLAFHASRQTGQALSGISQVETRGGAIGTSANSTEGARLAGHVIRTPTRYLTAEDEFFKVLFYRMSIAGEATRSALAEPAGGRMEAALADHITHLIQNPTPEMHDKAVADAHYHTFQRDLGKFGNGLIALKRSHPAWSFIIPFVKTPANMAMYAGERLGPLAYLHPNVRAELAKDGREADLVHAKVAMGAMLMGMAGMMAANKMLTGGGPTDQGKRSALMATGWRPYSVRVYNPVSDRVTYLPYNSLGPAGMVAGFAADLFEPDIPTLNSADRLGLVGKGISAVVDNFASQTFWKGFSDLSNVTTDPQHYLEKYVDSVTGAIVPNIVAKMAQATDIYQRDAKDDDIPTSMIENLAARVPGLSYAVTPRLSATGQPVTRTEGLGDAAMTLASPFNASSESQDPAVRELGKFGIGKTYAPRKISFAGKDRQLTADQRRDFELLHGQEVGRMLEPLVARPSYARLSEVQQEQMLKRVHQQASETATQMFVGRHARDLVKQ